MRNLVLFLVLLAAVVTKAEVVNLKLETTNSSCKDGLAQVVITQDKNMIYHLEMPMYGTAQVHLLYGNYQIDVKNKEGCEYQNIIQIGDTALKPVEIKLEKPTTETAATNASASAVRAPATMNEALGVNPYPSMAALLWPSPWWSPWGQSLYQQNFYSPCSWSYWGCRGAMYPHGGNIAMGKPNIYITGKESGKFKLKFTGNSFNFLATVPAFTDKDLTAEMRNGRIYAENTNYPYVFYDARVEDQHLQNNTGFCGNRADIFNFMIQGLRKNNFPDQAVNDFGEYWSVKIPEANRYCVFPQINAQLDKTAPIELTFDDKSIVQIERLFYLIIPQNYKNQRLPSDAHKFTNKPKNVWKHTTRTIIPKTPYLHEWGVGFIFE